MVIDNTDLKDCINPIWDDSGRLKEGCSVKTACEWLTKFGGRSPNETITINGVFYGIFNILHHQPDIASKTIIALESGYSGNIGFKV